MTRASIPRRTLAQIRPKLSEKRVRDYVCGKDARGKMCESVLKGDEAITGALVTLKSRPKVEIVTSLACSLAEVEPFDLTPVVARFDSIVTLVAPGFFSFNVFRATKMDIYYDLFKGLFVVQVGCVLVRMCLVDEILHRWISYCMFYELAFYEYFHDLEINRYIIYIINHFNIIITNIALKFDS